jgi:hypothetical protein
LWLLTRFLTRFASDLLVNLTSGGEKFVNCVVAENFRIG